MTIARDMAVAVGKAALVLGDSTRLVAEFLYGQVCPDGGFAGRNGDSDLYYTVFGLGALPAVAGDVDCSRFRSYIDGLNAQSLPDLVHLSAYIRCCFLLNVPVQRSRAAHLLERFRTPDGGFGACAGDREGSVYSCFLALGAYQDIGVQPPDECAMLRSVESLQMRNGAFSNTPGAGYASIPATAAAVVIGRNLDRPFGDRSLQWLLGRSDGCGGFPAFNGAGCPPDLLSTAVALHALAPGGVDLGPLKEPTLDFLDSLWSGRGGFSANPNDACLDCEYTYYGLLAMGHLADV